MWATLISNLGSLQSFFSRSFFIAAFLPTLTFLVINGLILFVWNWPFHNWVRDELLDAHPLQQTVISALLFFAVWIWSYIVAALTPHWIRSLEGANWWNWSWLSPLNKEGQAFHAAEYDRVIADRDHAAEIMSGLNLLALDRKQRFRTASLFSTVKPTQPHLAKGPLPDYRPFLRDLERQKAAHELVDHTAVKQFEDALLDTIREYGVTPESDAAAAFLTLLHSYAYFRAEGDYLRAVETISSEFGSRSRILPTRFGNVGQVAHEFARRVYGCNLALAWSHFRRRLSPDEAEKLQDCKAQLDFLVASFWLSLTQGFGWAVVFAFDGEIVGAAAALFVGPAVAWWFWYGASVEQYKALQALIISILSGPIRFKVIEDFRLPPPADSTAERALWDTLHQMVFNHSNPPNITYVHPEASEETPASTSSL